MGSGLEGYDNDWDGTKPGANGSTNPHWAAARKVGLVLTKHTPGIRTIPTSCMGRPPAHQFYLCRNTCALAEAIWQDSRVSKLLDTRNSSTVSSKVLFSNITPSSAGSCPAPSTGVMHGKRKKCTLSFQLVPQIWLDIKSQEVYDLCSHLRAVSTCLCPYPAQCSHGGLAL